MESETVKDITLIENRKKYYNIVNIYIPPLLYYITTAAKPYHNRVVREHRLEKIKQITVDIWLKLWEGQVLLDSQLYVTCQQSFDVYQSVFHPVAEGGHAVAEENAEYRHTILTIYLYGSWAYRYDLYVLQQPVTDDKTWSKH